MVNFACSSLALVGGYIIAITVDALGFPLAAVLGIAAAGLAALLIERLLVSRSHNADARRSPFSRSASTS